MTTLRLRPQIFDDLRVASDWYDARSPGLGNQFLSEFQASLDKIQDFPLAYAESEIGLRACRLARFPYTVFYRLDE